MGIVKQQSIKGSLVTYFGVILGAFNVFFVFPYFLNPETIGLLKSIEATGLLVVPLVYLGIPYAINKFYSVVKQSNYIKFQILLSNSFLFLLANTILLSLLFVLFKENIASLFSTKSPLLSKWILVAIPVFIGMSWMIVLSSIAASNFRIAFPKLFERIFLRFLHIALIVLFSFAVLSQSSFIILFGFSYLFPTIIVFLYVVKRNYLPLSNISLKANSKFDFSEQKSYALFMSLSTIGTSIISHVGMLIVSSLLGLEMAGIFFIAFYMGFILDVPATNFSAILRPVLAQSLTMGDLKNVAKLYKKSAIIQFILSGFLYLLVAFNIDEIFSLMPNGNNYLAGKDIVLIIGAGYVLKNMAGCHFDILIMSKKYKYSVFITVLTSIITILLYYFFINEFALKGAAYASALTTALNTIFFVVSVYIFYKISPFSLEVLKLVLIFLILLIVNYFVPEINNSFISIFINSIIITTIFLLLIFTFKISEDVNQIFEKFSQKIKLIIKI